MLVSALKFLSLHMAKVIREETVFVSANVKGVTSKKKKKKSKNLFDVRQKMS